ncbi:hypothetical protein AC579_3578 [Pseudocercospora musae]|uniref:protein-tyrosine-phosphatase n=1 Tax=Pseudocercospora musae TaxID=113226 RepID=A0A139IVV0_9PEZI|nr:hypothetical protein AC579_3578 [Pseudocercospora musae]
MSHMDEQTKQLPQPSMPSTQRSLQPSPEYESFVRKFHQHQLSDSTNTTGSNDSSPTTTISTVDDSSATEPSPGSSPESPPPTTFAVGMLRPRTADDRTAPFFELQKQPLPRKGRNLKNLAVNTSGHGPRAASTTSLPLQVQPDQNASVLSPAFVKPPTPPRRKPSNLGLTIFTPGGSKPAPQEIKLAIPPTPGVTRPSLRHFQSSPSLPLVPSLGIPHYNASDFQKPRLLETISSPVEQPVEAPQIAEAEEEEEEQNFDVPLSREAKPEAYPDGPICVYDPSIDLYLEPTAEQARQYDVIMNVASEVRNPLLRLDEPAATEPELRIDGGGGIQFAPKKERDHLVVKKEDALAQDASSPTTPKASPLNATFPTEVSTVNDPEYIHIPWEHNSDIVPDLLRLCKLIDDKVTQGKRVLIHCQCGVSRSASLVVAYGLYKNPSISVQEAYDAVKKRSKWIGPNMNLIMQLQEFRSSLARGGLLTARSTMSPLTPGSALSGWNGPFATIPPAMRNEPLSAVEPPSAANAASNGDRGVLSPGPSSAPSFPWPLPTTSGARRQRSISAVKPATAYVDPSGHVLPVQPVLPVLQVIAADAVHAKPPGPVRQVSSPEGFSSQTATESVGSPRSAEFAMTPLHPSKEVEAADDFGIMSPTSTEFTTSPFDRSALLAQLGMGSMRADEEIPRRSTSLRNRERQQNTMRPGHSEQSRKGLEATQPRRLRGKVSSPSLHQQQELQALQAKIAADLSIQRGSSHAGSPQFGQFSSAAEEPLMSPRATEFTSNPFTLSLGVPSPMSDDDNNSGSGSGSGNAVPRISDIDPRSPAHKGASPITRSILDVL